MHEEQDEEVRCALTDCDSEIDRRWNAKGR
jgi:hypothetical protein